MMKQLATVLLAAVFVTTQTSAARADQTSVSGYVQALFRDIEPACTPRISNTTCTATIDVVVNTVHRNGNSLYNSPATGSIRYCHASGPYAGWTYTTRNGLTASGMQLRSETSPPFAQTSTTCTLVFDVNTDTMKFEGLRINNFTPTVVYNLQVENGMLVGTTQGFTAVIVFFETPSAYTLLKK